MIEKEMAPQKGGQGLITSTFNSTHHLHPRQPIKGIAAYERLRAEWVNANPEHSELELLTACVSFAKVCGLVLREKLLAYQMQEMEGRHG